ncbi:unnamed protein product, partial [Linum tenue]
TSCLLLLPFLFLLVHLPQASPQLLKGCGFSAIYNFGDSMSDTGNALMQFDFVGSGKHPYGMFVGDEKPTDKFSDGYLLIDRIGHAYELIASKVIQWISHYSRLHQGMDVVAAHKSTSSKSNGGLLPGSIVHE